MAPGGSLARTKRRWASSTAAWRLRDIAAATAEPGVDVATVVAVVSTVAIRLLAGLIACASARPGPRQPRRA